MRVNYKKKNYCSTCDLVLPKSVELCDCGHKPRRSAKRKRPTQQHKTYEKRDEYYNLVRI